MLTVKSTKFSLEHYLMTSIAGVLLFASGCCSSCNQAPVACNTCPPSGVGCSPEVGCTSAGGCAAEIPVTGMAGGVGCGTDMACNTCDSGVCNAGCSVGAGGCGIMQTGYSTGCNVPRELCKTSFPEYRVEPPDVLLIEAIHNLRPANDPIVSGEMVIVQANRTLPTLETADAVSNSFKQINGPYVIGTDGYVNLGPEYGKVLCAGQPLAEIQRRIEVHLNRILKDPQVLVTLPDPSAKQVVSGQHLVRQDGTVGLGIYGGVYVAGMTLREAKAAIESHLSQHMHSPEVNVDVLSYNSKVYYVIADNGGAGATVHKIPCMGNECVLDAIAQVRGLPTVANDGQIWIARPSPNNTGCDQVLHVDWDAISQGAQTCTNYQIFPGDRLYVKADKWITFDTKLAKITAPLERVLGFTILGNGAVRSLQGGSNLNNGGGF